MTHSRGCICLHRGRAFQDTHIMLREVQSVLGSGNEGWKVDRYKIDPCIEPNVSLSHKNWLHLIAFLTFCHYCHFTWELEQQRGNAVTADWPQLLFIWLIFVQTMLFFLHCSGGYIGRRWEGANTGEMSHQGSQRGIKPCPTSAGSLAPLCPK